MAALRPFPPTPSSFPSFAPSASPSNGRPAKEVRFSRWNNANAEPFERRRRLQQEIEDDIRLHRRHESASRIAEISSPAEDPASSAEFKSRGTPSSPSAPSIRGRASKYSKPPRRRDRVDMNHSSTDLSHPAFRSIRKVFTRKPLPVEQSDPAITIGEKGIAYKFEEAPFVFQYSYTETPKVKPVALRETPYLPFGPNTMPRPWTGRAPLPPSKKKLPEFDSFKPPPPGKKGVKHVQAPGPFVAGSGPRHAMSREEVLGEPLTTEEVRDLVRSCIKTTRQLNMGRDGLTHNMLDNIHAHWKRRRVCKIKCKGVCTVDMDNVRQQLEEKTGGKVIYSKGGVIYLFRGRNYNYRSRPKFPLMLWKPTPPVYPRLVDRVPEGLTLEEATEMRKKGRQLPPICKLGKNGVYLNLVKNVKEAFEECELVRIDCKGMNKSDCRKIGAKLKDLVPCVLLSFEFEHILMWRGNDWKSSLPPLENNPKKASDADPFLAELEEMTSESGETSDEDSADLISAGYTSLESDQEDNADETEQDAYECESEQEGSIVGNYPDSLDDCRLSLVGTNEVNAKDEFRSAVPNQRTVDQIEENLGTTIEICNSEDINGFHSSSADTPTFVASRHTTPDNNKASEPVESSQLQQKMSLEHTSNCLVHMLKNAIETGSAVLLDDGPVDADVAYQRAVELAKTATPGPVFKHSGKKVKSRKTELRKGEERDSKESLAEVTELSETKVTKPSKRSSKARSKDLSSFPDVVPHGSLKVDELAKLLA